MMPQIQTGLEHFISTPPAWAKTARFGLLANPASVTADFMHARDAIHRRFPGQLKALFSPQHGFFAEKQDNMVESAHGEDRVLGIPIYSLYGDTRWPKPYMFDDIDVLLVDLQDVGTRVYTFIYTLSYCMAAAGDHVRIVILDRPNPIGGRRVEGNVLEPEWASFVGRFPLPMRHGMTIGEIARLFADPFGIDCDLTVIPMNGWHRDMPFSGTGLPWIPPSPNLPTPASGAVYPGQVIWEGTHVSEGRGTTTPFELFGAPFIDTAELLSDLDPSDLSGVHLREALFEPTFHKWAGQVCRGFFLHVTNPDTYCPYETALRILQAIIRRYPDQFQWKEPPYEYNDTDLPMDLILGSQWLRMQLEQGTPIDALKAAWTPKLTEFMAWRAACLLY
ncbi:MAG: hypothetical protein CSA22_10320 [Deltaproteobacteria bacterium]|nr:MAG: hypothetical protein CSA22_10320 [Deltaproteobacteria bacterium]